MIESSVVCPFCGEEFTVVVDCSENEQSYVEDCYVCCRPINFRVQCADGDLISIELHR